MFGSSLIGSNYRVTSVTTGEYDGAEVTSSVATMGAPTIPTGFTKGAIVIVHSGSGANASMPATDVRFTNNLGGGGTNGATKIIERSNGNSTLSVWYFDNAAVNSVQFGLGAGFGFCSVLTSLSYANLEVQCVFLEGVVSVPDPASSYIVQSAISIGTGGHTEAPSISGADGDIVIGVCTAADASMPGADTSGLFPAEADSNFTSANGSRIKQFIFIDDAAATTPEVYTYGMENTVGAFSYDSVKWLLIHASRS